MAEARQVLTGLGLTEAQGQTLLSDKAVAPGSIPLRNPLSSDMNVLRPSLLPGLLEALRHNAHHGTHDAALFEIARVFPAADGRAREEWRLGMAMGGHRHAPFWAGENRGAKVDVYDLKGVLEEFFDQFGIRGMTYVRGESKGGLWAESATIQLGKNSLGQFGQLMPTIARQLDLREAVFLAELSMDQLLARRNTGKTFKPLPLFPAIRRDIAMIVSETVTHEAVLDAVKQPRPANLESVQLFDVFRGGNIPSDQKSVAYSFTYRSTERTLKDEEVNATHEQVVAHLKRTLNAVVRE
jgi:phenylalanyl-tRNA synthetase beta chain